ncbi:MAG: winged helix-turn-helix transcriptional regulator [Methanobacteriaceae archaeon]|jgi:DNA-binding Lrp family transcriptional regulator|nr:winged helix-turn-helix transcriptional regulator [Candidatus Methanorudis spinitermitis]
MIMTLIKEESGKNFIKEMEKNYGSIEELEKLHKRTNNALMYVDLENWKYFLKHPDEKIKRGETKFINKISLSDIEMEILNTIKHKHPQSIKQLAKLINKDISTTHSKVKKMTNQGLLSIKEGNKNSKVPILNYDKIEISV